MSSFNRHRSLLLTLCALALLLWASASKVFGAQPRHGFYEQAAPVSAAVMAGDEQTVADHAHGFSHDCNSSVFDDDGGVDDEMVSPAQVHVVLLPARCDVPVSTVPSLQAAPSAGPLRPPRVA